MRGTEPPNKVVPFAPCTALDASSTDWNPIIPVVAMRVHDMMRPNCAKVATSTRVFIDAVNGSLLCKHGELGSTVSTWCQAEKLAARLVAQQVAANKASRVLQEVVKKSEYL